MVRPLARAGQDKVQWYSGSMDLLIQRPQRLAESEYCLAANGTTLLYFTDRSL